MIQSLNLKTIGATRAIASRFLRAVPIAMLGVLMSVLVVASPALATSLYEMPLVGVGDDTWIVDKAEVISRANEGRLSKDFRDLAEQTGTEVRMATIRHFDYGETIDSFTNKLFERWYPTPEEQANQVLLVVDKVTNKIAIRTGTAVAETMPDAIAQSVAQETAIAPLREGDKYNQSFLDASERMIAVLSGEPDPGPPAMENEVMSESTFTSAEDTDTNNATIIVIGFLVAATVIPMATYYLYQIFQS
ncbi:MAG: TPM domain-containing protein [Leptolyngbyaceae bacterium]|nr:TPM domain-containing protein [Leptolyngbyaceae bacterium]